MKFLKITDTGAWEYKENIPNNAVCLCKNTANVIAETIEDNSTLIDIGCGVGHYLKYIKSNSKKQINLIGIEPSLDKSAAAFDNIIAADITKPIVLSPGNVMCLEVLEHIPKQYETAAVENIVINCNKYLFISWAAVGQPGDGHVNCKNINDVIKLFESHGFELEHNITAKLKTNASFWWLKNNLCCFTKR
jgi:hypothetical protein